MRPQSPDKSLQGGRRRHPDGAQRRALQLLGEAQHVIHGALASLLDESAPPEIHPCVYELIYASTWFGTGLGRHLPRTKERAPDQAVARLGVSAERMAELPTFADRLRLINRAQRWTVAQIACLLAEDLDPDLRALLEEASAIYLRGGRRCDEIIAALDRDRDLPSESG